MKKTIKIFAVLITLMAVPALAGLGIMALWNSIIAAACGFAIINFWQSTGLFVLGQLLSGGFLLLLFMLFGSIHAISHHREDWHNHWHNMTDEQRREFILRRREHFGFCNHYHNAEDASER